MFTHIIRAVHPPSSPCLVQAVKLLTWLKVSGPWHIIRERYTVWGTDTIRHWTRCLAPGNSRNAAHYSAQPNTGITGYNFALCIDVSPHFPLSRGRTLLREDICPSRPRSLTIQSFFKILKRNDPDDIIHELNRCKCNRYSLHWFRLN
jgi:hypothetical protein